MNSEEILEKLFQYYNVASYVDLAEKMQITRQTITNWKARNSINGIKKKCRELGIFNDIFGNIKVSTSDNFDKKTMSDYISYLENDETLKDYLASQAQDNKTADDIDSATYILFREAYKKAIENNDLKGLRVHLMDY